MNTGSINCAKGRDTMMLALYEEASGADIASLRAHLYSCHRCSEEWEQLSSAARTISHAEGGQPRPALALAFPKPAIARKRFGLIYAAAATVLFAAIIGASGLVPRLWRAASSAPSDTASLATHPAAGATAVTSATTSHQQTDPGPGAVVGVASNREAAGSAASSRTSRTGRTSAASSSDSSEDVLEAELRSLDSALSTLESGQEEL